MSERTSHPEPDVPARTTHEPLCDQRNAQRIAPFDCVCDVIETVRDETNTVRDYRTRDALNAAVSQGRRMAADDIEKQGRRVPPFASWQTARNGWHTAIETAVAAALCVDPVPGPPEHQPGPVGAANGPFCVVCGEIYPCSTVLTEAEAFIIDHPFGPDMANGACLECGRARDRHDQEAPLTSEPDPDVVFRSLPWLSAGSEG